MKGLLSIASLFSVDAGKVCNTGTPHGKCSITGEGCDWKQVEFDALNLTVMKWDKQAKKYEDKPVGFLEAHAIVGTEKDWQMYLHGPMIRPKREQGEFDVPPFYVSATFTNEMYRFENLTKQGRGKPMKAVQKMVSNVVAPSTSYAIEDDDGKMTGMLIAEGQPFLANSMLHPAHTEFNFGGVEYVSDSDPHCDKVFPNKHDNKGSFLTHTDVVNTVSCHPDTHICFFTVWRFFDDTMPMHNGLAQKLMPDCLHYCVFEGLDEASMKKGCLKGGVVEYEDGNRVCSTKGVGAVHGMTVAHTDKEDPTKFDIFLVMTGGAQFVGGESSIRKVGCQKTKDGDLKVLKHERFGRDLFEASVGRVSPDGMAPLDAGGDHAWPDDSGKYLWASTFRYGNSGVHMLDYETGELIYSVLGMADYVPHNYAYSAGIHGVGQLGQKNSHLLTATSACTAPKSACAPIPYNPITKALDLEAKGIMYAIDISEILSMDSDNVLV